MTLRADYRFVRDGNWRIWVHDRLWNASVWLAVRSTIEKQTWQSRPQTTRMKLQDGSEETFLKIYFPSGPGAMLKDVFRVSKAIRHWQQSLALTENGFLTPPVIAAGEQRSFRKLEKAFVLTTGMPAISLSAYLHGLGSAGQPCFPVLEKRKHIRKLGHQIGRMHELGFVHGDLVLSNILIGTDRGEVSYYYIDHDRTRRYPRWLPQLFWKRNLVQLNRTVLPGITLSDRMGFFRAYAAARIKPYWWHERRLLRWIESRTRRRRLECDGVTGDVSFRELMRWNGPYGDKRGGR